MNNKSVLITGTSTGFGRRLVTEFLRAGWRVIATLRNAEDRKELFADDAANAPDRLFILSLDVAREQERAAVAEFIAKQLGGRLDCLVNNAGFGVVGAFEDLSETQIREQMEVNFFGLALLTRDLLPALRNARGRVINISSVLGYTGMPLSSLYCASKFAVEGLSESLYYELQPHGVQVAMVEPGAYGTGFRTNIVYGEKSFAETSAYKSQFAAFSDSRNRRDDGPGTPIDPVINAVMRLAAAKKMPLRVRCGKDAKAAYAAKRLLPAGLHRTVMSKVYEKLFARRPQER
jgi:NAD(P)-dependent dehydrogenase (short-subunit alcohol dehydrogenase family)